EFSGNPNLTVKEALDRAAAKIGERFQDQPLVEAAIRMTIGAAYSNLGEYQPAALHLERALALRRVHLGLDHRDIIRSMYSLADTYRWMGRLPDAIFLSQHIVEKQKALLGPDHPETLDSLGRLAGIYRAAGQWDAGRALLEPILEK